MVNGKRRHRASVIAFQGGGVNDGAQGPDISVIPSVALKQVEVLRDGAAVQYGSDAIAGVMNFVLKDDTDGGSMSVKYGQYSEEDDGATVIVDGNIGMPFTDNGLANFSFQLKNADDTSRSAQRPDAAALAAAGNSDINDPAPIWGNPKIDDDITVFGNIGLDLGDDKDFYLFGNYSERDVTGGSITVTRITVTRITVAMCIQSMRVKRYWLVMLVWQQRVYRAVHGLMLRLKHH